MFAFGGKADMAVIPNRRACNQSVIMYLVVSMPQREGLSMGKALCLTFLLSLLFPQWAIAQQPIAPVPMTPFGDGQDSVLTGNLEYRVLQTTFVIVVPTGFVTDFASTPRALWSVIPPIGRYQLAAVVHDFLYWDQGCTREQADAIFRVAMAESNVKPYERDLMWQAVRRFGQSAWNDNAAAKQAEKPRIVPAAYMNIPPLVTWSDYQDQLVRQGIKPAPTPATPPVYCTAGISATLSSP
jgi:Protein of unknown function (DUF1353)